MEFFTYVLCVIFLFELVIAKQITRQAEGVQNTFSNVCIAPDRSAGRCLPYKQCSSFLQWAEKNRSSPEFAVHLRELHTICGNRNIERQAVICCSDPYNDTPQAFSTAVASSSITQPGPPSKQESTPNIRKSAKGVEDNYKIECIAPDQSFGVCVPYKQCSSLLQWITKNKGSQRFNAYLRGLQTICGNEIIERQPVICCSDSYNDPSQPSSTASTRTVDAEEKLTTLAPLNPAISKSAKEVVEGCTDANLCEKVDCITPDFNNGTCSTLRTCPFLIGLYLNHTESAIILMYLTQSQLNCGNKRIGDDPLVCCTEVFNENYPSNSTIQPSKVEIPTTPSAILTPTSLPVNISSSQALKIEDHCISPDNYNGTCVPLRECPYLIQHYLELEDSSEATLYFTQSQVNCRNKRTDDDPFVCCVKAIDNIPISRSIFGNFGRGEQRQPIDIPTITTTTSTTQTPAVISSETIEEEIQDCMVPDGWLGLCKNLTDCPEYLTRLQANPKDASFIALLMESNRRCNAKPPIICCPDEKGSTPPGVNTSQDILAVDVVDIEEPILLTPDEGCGQTNEDPHRILGDRTAKPGSWPWIALLGYDSPNGIQFRCGGSLISRKHVITAARCIESNLRLVRLGEYDLRNDKETRQVDMPVVGNVRHPSFNSDSIYYDVAVISLAKSLLFTDTIRPICIPDKTKYDTRSLTGYTPLVAGWGTTLKRFDSVDVLHELELIIFDNRQCEEQFPTSNVDMLNGTTICAGYFIGGKRPCLADYGGPLMMAEKTKNGTGYYNLLGIVVYGADCARNPSTYISVPYFSDWIRDTITRT